MPTEQLRVLVRAPLVGQGARFVLSGAFVALVYTATTSILAHVVGLHFQVALVIGYTVGLATHFALQRLFVWTHEDGFELGIHHQLPRYLLLALAQYGLTAAITATVPNALGVPTEAVYLVTVALLGAANFVILRTRVFHPARR
jgi:putative flippase GtrA